MAALDKDGTRPQVWHRGDAVVFLGAIWVRYCATKEKPVNHNDIVSQLQDYLNGFRRLALTSVGEASEIYRLHAWMVRVSVGVHIKPYKEIPGLEPIVKKFLKLHTPMVGHCYHNAFKLAIFDERIEYVSGYAAGLIPIEHGWNSFNGEHFDLTKEIALRRKSRSLLSDTYLQVVKLDKYELCRHVLKTETISNLFQEVFEETKIK